MQALQMKNSNVYNINMATKEYRALLEWIDAVDYDVFVTLRFNRQVSKQRVIEAVKRYLHILDKKIMGRHNVRNDIRIERYVALENGTSNSNWHCHVLFNSSSTVATAEELKTLAEHFWHRKVKDAKQYDRQNKFNGKFKLKQRQRDFELIEDNNKVKRYVIGEHYKLGNDTILVECCYFSEDTQRLLKANIG